MPAVHREHVQGTSLYIIMGIAIMLLTLTAQFNSKMTSFHEYITGYLKNYWAKDRLVCTHFDAFFNAESKYGYGILFYHFDVFVLHSIF